MLSEVVSSSLAWQSLPYAQLELYDACLERFLYLAYREVICENEPLVLGVGIGKLIDRAMPKTDRRLVVCA